MPTLELKKCHEWHRVGDVIMTFTSAGDMEDKVWNEFLVFLKAQEGARIVFCVASNDQGTMSANQRKSGAEILKQMNLHAIVVTDSRLVRGILTAVGWLGADVRPQSWAALDTAVKQASDDPTTQKTLFELATEFRRRTSSAGPRR